MSNWQSFFSAQVSASAALLGLLFVSLSINLSKIISFRALPNRAFSALLSLLIVLIVSSLLLAPEQPVTIVSAEVLLIGLCAWATATIFDLKTWRSIEPGADYRPRLMAMSVLNQLAMLLYIASGGVLLTKGLDGLYLLVPAFLFSFAKAALDAWVLLVEINR